MVSRYSYMTEGNTFSERYSEAYPDPLTLSYLNFKLNNKPSTVVVNSTNINHFWAEALNHYGSAAYDDIVLTLNGISHINFLDLGEVVYFPQLLDLKNSFNKDKS